jgi:UDP-N-acetylmuramoylalanine--D-glutamate ligase
MLGFKDKNVMVLGLGISGLAMARWAHAAGANLVVADTRAEPPGLAALRSEMPDVAFIQSAFSAELAQRSDLQYVLKSPGLSPEEIAPFLIAINDDLTETFSELSVFSMALQDLRTTSGYSPSVLAITGTNGKTTVTALTTLLLERAGKSVAMAGNIGPSLLDTLSAHIHAQTLPQVWVLELSSFQLHDVSDFEPYAATVLNITEDHLDWHGSMHNYTQCKKRIFGNKAVMVLNRDDEVVMEMGKSPIKSKNDKTADRDIVYFGADEPTRPGDFGIQTQNGMQWLVRASQADETLKRKRKRGAEQEIYIQRLMPCDALRLRGQHNALNALAALALASTVETSLAGMLYGLREYKGEPHRVQSVAIIDGVEYFDDSKGTNVGATVAALNGLGSDRKLVVILGGDAKGQNFTPLASPISQYARAVILIGRDASLIRETIGSVIADGISIVDASTLPEAVRLAAQSARSGDAVLLSPACASLDMFRNYGHRAQVFCEAVEQLALDVGQSVGVVQ